MKSLRDATCAGFRDSAVFATLPFEVFFHGKQEAESITGDLMTVRHYDPDVFFLHKAVSL